MPVARVSHVISEQNIYPGLSRPHFVVVVHDHPVAVRGCRSLSETRDTHAHGEWWHEGVAPPHSGHAHTRIRESMLASGIGGGWVMVLGVDASVRVTAIYVAPRFGSRTFCC